MEDNLANSLEEIQDVSNHLYDIQNDDYLDDYFEVEQQEQQERAREQQEQQERAREQQEQQESAREHYTSTQEMYENLETAGAHTRTE